MTTANEKPDRLGSLPARARLYYAALAALAVGGLAAAVASSDTPPDPTLLAVLVVACAAGSAVEAFAPGHYALQPNYALFFWGAVMLAPWAIPVLAVACFGASFVLHRSPAYKSIFNVVNYTLTGLAAWALSALSGFPAAGEEVTGGHAAALAAGALLAAGVNHLTLIVMVALATGGRVRGMLHQLVEGVPLSIGVGLTGGCLAALWSVESALVLLGAGPVALITRSLWVPMLRQRAQTDAKTGLHNSEAFEEAFQAALATARKHRTRLVVVMMDLDYLRTINNSCGHLAGDRAIKGMADALVAATPDGAFSARFGGEEFSLLIPRGTVEQAQAVVEEVSERVRQIRFRASDEELRVTFSAGVASFPEHGDTTTALVKAADEALYAAKAAGRDCLRVAASNMRPSQASQPVIAPITP